MDEAPESIRVAVGRLSGVPGVFLESSPELISDESSWAVWLRLTSTCTSDFVPKHSRWVALVDCSYPAGRIRFFPAQDGGLVHTFPHQELNVKFDSGHATWRAGKICLDSSSQRLGRLAGGPEPKGDAEQRLRWHVERCLAWLELAANNQLMVDDEPFEVPQCPSELLNSNFTVVHDEGDDTWRAWDGRIRRCGEIHWGMMPGLEKTIVAEEFFDACGDPFRRCRRHFNSGDKPWVGYWWLWPSPIVIPPWQAPCTWGELRRIGMRLNVDVDGFIRWLAHRVGGKKTVVILLGYPIPKLWGSTPVEVHWQAILPPEVPVKIKPMKGFRANARGKSERLQREFFNGSKKLSYLKTENWHPNRLQARGRFSLEVRTRSVAVIGAGALGSSVAELLARGGIADILIVDQDSLEAGNLVRHTLTSVDLGCNKAKAIATRLQGAAPMSRITSHTGWLPRGDALQLLLEPFEVVLDCTGDDDVLRLLGEAWWAMPRYFLSASLGFAANRAFLFEAHACSFPFEEFETAMLPWLAAERSQLSVTGETLEGAGCWSPLFPARSDDVWLAAIATVKHLERFVEGKVSDGLRVLEQRSEEGFAGYQPVEQNPSVNLTDDGVNQ